MGGTSTPDWVEELLDRISKRYMPEKHEVQTFLDERYSEKEYSKKQREAIKEGLMKRAREPEGEAIRKARSKAKKVYRNGTIWYWTTAKSKRGKKPLGFADPEIVSTWSDRWGNLMGHNKRTGERGVVLNAEDR